MGSEFNWTTRLKNQIRWFLKMRPFLPRKVYLEAAQDVCLHVNTIYTGNLVAWSKRQYGLKNGLLKYEIPETSLFLNRIHSASIFYDIGSQIGYYSLIAASQKNINRVVAFEILDSFAREIRKHANKNRFRNITVETAAVGNGHTFIEHGNFAGFSRKKSISIDEYVESSGLVPDFIKMDIEGYEYLALQGATKTLNQRKPDLLLSLHPNFIEIIGGDIKSMLALLQDVYKYFYFVDEYNSGENDNLNRFLKCADLSTPPFENCTLYCSVESPIA